MKLLAPPVMAMDIGCVVLVQENLLGTALRELGEEEQMNPLASCFLIF